MLPRRSTRTTRTSRPVIEKVKNAGAQMVYFGGEYPQAAPLTDQMKAKGVNIPLMGGDGMYDPKYIELAGKRQR